MTKRIFLATLACLSLTTLASPVFADHDHDKWSKKYDHDHDGRWNYEEYCAWERAHHHHLSDKQLRENFDRYDANRDGYWQREEFYNYHH